MIDNLVNPDAEDDEEEGEFERSDAYDDPFIPQENAEPQLAAEPLFSVLLKRAVAQIDPDDQVLLDFATHVAPALSLHLAHKTAKGGDFITAMRAEGKAEETLSRFSDDQSMRAHLVNGLFPVAHIARLLRRWNIWRFVEYFDDQTYRLFCAGYTLHDWLKLPDVEAELIAHGKPRDTPVAIVRRASWPQQRTMLTTLGELPTVLAPGKMRPPAIVIVGEAVAERAASDWFASRPLVGRTILVTRPIEQSEGLVESLSELGAAVLVQPAIEIGPPRDWAPADTAIGELDAFDWLVFSSANGVRYFLERLRHHQLDLRALGQSKIAAIAKISAM